MFGAIFRENVSGAQFGVVISYALTTANSESTLRSIYAVLTSQSLRALCPLLLSLNKTWLELRHHQPSLLITGVR
jgi:hypothetical protein